MVQTVLRAASKARKLRDALEVRQSLRRRELEAYFRSYVELKELQNDLRGVRDGGIPTFGVFRKYLERRWSRTIAEMSDIKIAMDNGAARLMIDLEMLRKLDVQIREMSRQAIVNDLQALIDELCAREMI
jgi:hypothetical protein